MTRQQFIDRTTDLLIELIPPGLVRWLASFRTDVERTATQAAVDAAQRARAAAVALEQELAEAMELVEYSLHLQMYGERAPGGDETWHELNRRTEAFVRRGDDA
jgi:hypothetical protein